MSTTCRATTRVTGIIMGTGIRHIGWDPVCMRQVDKGCKQRTICTDCCSLDRWLGAQIQSCLHTNDKDATLFNYSIFACTATGEYAQTQCAEQLRQVCESPPPPLGSTRRIATHDDMHDTVDDDWECLRHLLRQVMSLRRPWKTEQATVDASQLKCKRQLRKEHTCANYLQKIENVT